MKKPAIFALGLVVGAVIATGPTIASFASWYFRQRAPQQASFQNAVLVNAPFDGEWLISWGGEKKEDNHHIGSQPQDRAVDIRKIIEGSGGQTMRGDPRKNESYGCWAQPIYSPIDGVVVVSVDGVPDNIPGELNHLSAGGNYVMIESPEGFVVVLAHLKQGSVAARAGVSVKAGDFLGLCGNSGRSTEPHLHLHVQSGTSVAKSVALRMVFPFITVGGVQKENYSPSRGDVISNGTKQPNRPPEPTRASAGLHIKPEGRVAHR